MKRFFLFIGNLVACILQRTFWHWLKSSCFAKLLASRANCSGQIISLRHLKRFQMRQIYLKNKKQESLCQLLRVSTFYDNHKASFLQFLWSRGARFIREQIKVNFTNLVICSLYWLLSWRAVTLQMNRTVKYQGEFSWIVGFADKCFLFLPPPFHFLFAPALTLVL